MTELRDKALAALDEAHEEAQRGPVPKSAGLRFTLAFLSGFTDDRSIFDTFWKVATNPPTDETYSAQYGRRQSLNNARLVIYRSLGVEPEG